MSEVRPLRTLTLSEIALIARDLADAGYPCEHSFDLGSEQEAEFERAYLARKRELEQVEV